MFKDLLVQATPIDTFLMFYYNNNIPGTTKLLCNRLLKKKITRLYQEQTKEDPLSFAPAYTKIFFMFNQVPVLFVLFL